MSAWIKGQLGDSREIGAFSLWACPDKGAFGWLLDTTDDYTILEGDGCVSLDAAKRAAEDALRKLCADALSELNSGARGTTDAGSPAGMEE